MAKNKMGEVRRPDVDLAAEANVKDVLRGINKERPKLQTLQDRVREVLKES